MTEPNAKTNLTALATLDNSKAVEIWKNNRDAVLQEAGALTKIENQQDYDNGTAIMAKINQLVKDLEKERKSLTEPLDKIKREIMGQEKALVKDLDTARYRLRVSCGEYYTNLQRERELAEQRKRAEEAERQMQNQTAADLFGAESAAVKATPTVIVPTRATSENAKAVEVWDFAITDETKLDRKFLSPDPSKIRAFLQYAKKMGQDPETLSEPGLKITKSYRIDGK